MSCPEFFWPSEFHYAGLFFDEAGREPNAFPWEKLDGSRLVYASLGTLVNGMPSIYQAILAAVGRMPEIQVVLAKGNNIELNELDPIPSNVIVVDKVPQLEILRRSLLCMTHADLNTYDQFGVAIRIAYHGVGEFLEVDKLPSDDLYELTHKVLHIPPIARRPSTSET